MGEIMKKPIKSSIRILSFALVLSLGLGVTFAPKGETKATAAAGSAIRKYFSEFTLPYLNNIEEYFDPSAITRLPESVSPDEEISVIVELKGSALIDEYVKAGGSLSVGEYAMTNEGKAISARIEESSDALMSKIDGAGIDYVLGERYDTLLGGFELTVKAFDFERLNAAVGNAATLIVGEVYNKCETEVVRNYVDVYETGIFDSSDSEYQGDGVIVAVLDTGLDYTHTAFSDAYFTTDNEAYTLERVSSLVGKTSAAKLTSGLTGEDVYVSRKVPYAYDYADKDPDVLPINSEHGTHVAGVIAGNDDVITGVAPNAQLAIMKVFSDISTGAKSSWLLAALEDCVNLGVDVINMSLGSGCGFSREEDGKAISKIYDKIGEAGISLITAAGNDSNSTSQSKKNGTNPLSKNPDSGTVGSPSTYTSALSVASVDGVMTPYLMYGDRIIYFNEASTSAAKTKDFVDDLLKTLYKGGYITDPDYAEVEYVTIPGIGRSSDYFYDKSYYAGKIVLVKRGQTTFEEKIRIALKDKGAAGVIIYNNISGIISMSVGADIGAACSISQDDGELLAANDTGKLIVSRSNEAGPFISSFSSWGPTSDLKIKPEITAHGGEILSAIPGQDYDRLSGTSMACPNEAGAAALIRQYVKSGKFGNDISPLEVTAIVNKLMMSTADIILNKNGLPYAVRRQGAGLVNIKHAYQTAAYVTTYDKDGKALDKSKLELGDDKAKTGVYEMTFDVTNVSGEAVSYDLDAIVMTEGLSKTYTSHSDTTLSQEGYLLDDAKTTVTAVTNGTANGNKVTIAAGETSKVSVKITLTDEDKKYLDASFRYGMYVEGFVTFSAVSGTSVDMNVPYLAFYGDWTEAPIFDEEFYDTNVDELNKGLDEEDKLIEDAYATKAIGGLYSDYIATLGSYYFVQDESSIQIPASKQHIALSNQNTGDGNSSINAIRDVWAGFLRNVKRCDIVITDDVTGEVIFTKHVDNLRKSFSYGSDVRTSSIEIEFSALEHQLKNNTSYTVTVSTYIDYGSNEEQNNARNVFTFPFYVDFEAPALTGVTYRTEYDRTTKKTSLFADISVYDNHYAMGMQLGRIVEAEKGSGYLFSMETFGKYVTPVYSSFNSTSVVTVDLTDYVADIRKSVTASYDANGNVSVVKNADSFIVSLYDYALNHATYEIRLPDEVVAMYFTEDEIRLSPNETLDIANVLNIYPSETWVATVDLSSAEPEVADVVGQTILAKTPGETIITAVRRYDDNTEVKAEVTVKVLAEGEEGYYGGYSKPGVSKFAVTGYKTLKAFYKTNTSDREIGVTGGSYEFGDSTELKMFPSEKVQLLTTLDTFFPNDTEIRCSVGNENVAKVYYDESVGGYVVLAVNEGTTIVSATVYFNGKIDRSTSIMITVKDPVETMSIYLMSYNGDGDENHVVTIPDDRGITTIYSFAFTGYEYVEKDLAGGDVIDEEDPYYIKQWYIGEDSIKKVIIPEGVTEIQSYAFAYLTALEEVVLPESLVRIGLGAFEGCDKLKTINLGHAKFINEKAFYGCALEEIDLSGVVSIGNYTFAKNKITDIVLPVSSQSLGEGAFADNKYLNSVRFEADKIKIGSHAFENCEELSSINRINAAVISSYAFNNCKKLSEVTLGKDVSVIGEYAFAGTDISSFGIATGNKALKAANGSSELNGPLVYKGDELVLVAPKNPTKNLVLPETVKTIGAGAFSGNKIVKTVKGVSVTTLGSYAFAGCSSLTSVDLPALTTIGDHAFYSSSLSAMPDLTGVGSIGDHAFAMTGITSVTIPDGCKVGVSAFAQNNNLATVTVGNDVELGKNAFYNPIGAYEYSANSTYSFNQYLSAGAYKAYDYEVLDENGATVGTLTFYRYDPLYGASTALKTVTLKDNVVVGENAFYGNAGLKTVNLGDNVKVGASAFYACGSLENVDFTKIKSVGANAFSGLNVRDLTVIDGSLGYATEITVINGVRVYGLPVYTTYAPALTSVDLTNTKLEGSGIFAYEKSLVSVTLGEDITSIPDNTFYGCSALSDIILTANVGKIGKGAFAGTAIKDIDLSDVGEIGDDAFANGQLESVTLKDGVNIGDGAFYNNPDLYDVENLSGAAKIGARAFMGVALVSADLSSAEYIGDFAFALDPIASVTFGDKLADIGENPFYGCPIETFGKVEELLFNQTPIGETVTEDYEISENVFVEDGVLYRNTSKGVELVAYPMLSDNYEYVVKEGTIRIADNAFFGCSLKVVTLPVSLLSIGDKAFYGCYGLETVVFKSVRSPYLEESYDPDYANFDNISMSGVFAGYSGIGITDYYMWNYTSTDAVYYFGANFVDRIGYVGDKLTMVRPTNGENYETFILSMYFDKVLIGSAAPTAATLDAIDVINALPSRITLADKSAVVNARTAYESLSTTEQKALVDNYNVLVDAEQTIAYLESRAADSSSGDSSSSSEEPAESSGDSSSSVPSQSDGGTALMTVALVICIVIIIGLLTVIALPYLRSIRKKKDGDR